VARCSAQFAAAAAWRPGYVLIHGFLWAHLLLLPGRLPTGTAWPSCGCCCPPAPLSPAAPPAPAAPPGPAAPPLARPRAPIRQRGVARAAGARRAGRFPPARARGGRRPLPARARRPGRPAGSPHAEPAPAGPPRRPRRRRRRRPVRPPWPPWLRRPSSSRLGALGAELGWAGRGPGRGRGRALMSTSAGAEPHAPDTREVRGRPPAARGAAGGFRGGPTPAPPARGKHFPRPGPPVRGEIFPRSATWPPGTRGVTASAARHARGPAWPPGTRGGPTWPHGGGVPRAYVPVGRGDVCHMVSHGVTSPPGGARAQGGARAPSPCAGPGVPIRYAHFTLGGLVLEWRRGFVFFFERTPLREWRRGLSCKMLLSRVDWRRRCFPCQATLVCFVFSICFPEGECQASMVFLFFLYVSL